MLIVLGLLTLVIFGWRASRYQKPEVVQVTPVPLSPTAVPPTATATCTPSPTRTPEPTATQRPSATPTATSSPTATPLLSPPPLFHATPVSSTTSVITSTRPQPTLMPLMAQPAGTINILLLGSDRRPGVQVSLTDVLMIASIFPDTPGVSLISIPRDYYAWIPTWGLDKINTAFIRGYKHDYPGGGAGLLKATIEY
ncbi:MAG: hypothetical protein U9Q70_09045, partial [Chloroflexota bacterium]|nr:hypothetical protein [Chloroflexota bacterium]